MTFQDPVAGDRISFDELNGSLLLIFVHELVKDVPTSFGDADAIRCDVTVLDGDHITDQYSDTLIFPRVLVSQLRKNVGAMVLGRLGQGAKKPGQNPPWILTAATDTEKQVGEKWLASITKEPSIDENAIV